MLFFESAEQIGVDILDNLHRDREVIERSRDRVRVCFVFYNYNISKKN